MIKIEIVDPQKIDEKTLIATAEFLFKLAGHEVHPAPTDGKAQEKEELTIHGLHPDLLNFEVNEETTFVVAGKDEPASMQTFPAPEGKPGYVPNAATAPVATIAPGEVDINGIPWDGRIHSRTKSKLMNGAWKVIRGVNPEYVEQITAELKANTVPVPMPPLTPPPVTPVPMPPLTPPPVTPVPMPPITPPPVIPPVPSEYVTIEEDVIDQTITFNDITTKLMQLISEGKITHGRVVEFVKSLGIESLPLLSTHPHLISKFNDLLDAEITK